MTYEVTQLDLTKLDDKTRNSYASLAAPQFQCCLEGKTPEEFPGTTITIFGATRDREPIGVLIATINPILNIANIHCLAVAESYRGQKIASQLLSEGIKAFKHMKCVLLSFIYPAAKTDITAFLEASGWNSPRLYKIQCFFDVQKFNPPWLFKEYPLPAGVSEFFWKDLTAEEREKLRIQEKQKQFPIAISPFQDEKKIELTNSLGLRFQNNVIGWMLTHRLSHTLIRYSYFYVQQEWQSKGPSMRVLCDAIKVQKTTTIPEAMCEVNVPQTDPRWVSFFVKRLVPETQSVIYLNQSWLSLST